MNKLSTEQRVAVLKTLVEGCSIASTVRLTGISKPTVLKLLADMGRACAVYQDHALRGLTSKRIQCDEIWAFCQMKEKNVPEEKRGEFGYGDVWTWVAIDADTKLVPCWHVGDRSLAAAEQFINDVASRLTHRVQLTTDGHKPYLAAVEGAFGCDVDYAMLVKSFGNSVEGQKRYSPAECCGAVKTPITGNPSEKHINTSFVERQNLTMRMEMRRFTRLTNGFSKKVENHMAAISLHYMHYNFCRVHKSLRVTPAMAAGITDHVWTMEEVVAILDRHEAMAAKFAAEDKAAKPSGLVPVRRRESQIG